MAHNRYSILEIVGNNNNDLGEVILTDQRNEVVVTPYTSGTITLRATYMNTLLHCGGQAEFEIFISKPLEITGEDNVCQNNSLFTLLLMMFRLIGH